MFDLVKCARCNKGFIAEAFNNHVCTPTYRGSKRILIDFKSTTRDEHGRETTMAVGMDGITYWLIENDQESFPIPFNPSDENLQERTNRRRLDRTAQHYAFIMDMRI